MPATATQPTREDFATMLEESFGRKDMQEGSVVKGLVVAIEKDIAVKYFKDHETGELHLKKVEDAAELDEEDVDLICNGRHLRAH